MARAVLPPEKDFCPTRYRLDPCARVLQAEAAAGRASVIADGWETNQDINERRSQPQGSSPNHGIGFSVHASPSCSISYVQKRASHDRRHFAALALDGVGRSLRQRSCQSRRLGPSAPGSYSPSAELPVPRARSRSCSGSEPQRFSLESPDNRPLIRNEPFAARQKRSAATCFKAPLGARCWGMPSAHACQALPPRPHPEARPSRPRRGELGESFAGSTSS